MDADDVRAIFGERLAQNVSVGGLFRQVGMGGKVAKGDPGDGKNDGRAIEKAGFSEKPHFKRLRKATLLRIASGTYSLTPRFRFRTVCTVLDGFAVGR